MKKKINIQFILVAAITIILTISLSTVIFYELFKKEVMEELKTYAHVLKAAESYEKSSIDGLRVTVINTDGTVEFDTNADIGLMDNHGKRPEIAEAFKDGEGKAIRRSSTLSKSTFYYAIMLDDGSVLRVAKEAGSIWSIFKSSLPLIFAIALAMMILCAMLAHFLTRSIVAPIEKLAVNMDNMETVVGYKELVPFINTIHAQHDDILKSAKMRQEFTANVSHELKTPLTSISGYSELIANGMATDKDVRRFAGEINNNSKRLLTLINDIIRLSELDSEASGVQFEQINLYNIADNCVNMLQLNASMHNVAINITGGDAFVNADREMMQELVYNLCDNAIRYNNENGRVDVNVSEDEKQVVLSVRDTGIGIPKKHQERIFERFYRVDKSRSKSTGGTGLGLAIVKHIVAQHPNSMIQVDSEEGKGTEIKVIFTKN